MKEEEIIKTLREEAQQNIPDVREKVISAYPATGPAEGEVLVKSNTRRNLLLAAAALLILLLLAATLGIFLLNRGGGAFKLVVSINPSVEFTVEDGRVSSTRSLNKDAVVLLQGEDFTGDTAEEAVLRFATLADSKHLIGADGIRIYAEGNSGSLAGIHERLAKEFSAYAVTDMDETAFTELLASYNEAEMGDFEDWLAAELAGQEAQFQAEIAALLGTYEADLAALDTSDPAAVQAFNQTYLRLGDDLIFEDGDEKKSELAAEFAELKTKLERNPDRVLDELFKEFIDELEDIYEDRLSPDADRDDEDDRDDDDDDRDDDD